MSMQKNIIFEVIKNKKINIKNVNLVKTIEFTNVKRSNFVALKEIFVIVLLLV